jgi:hypothetical protein
MKTQQKLPKQTSSLASHPLCACLTQKEMFVCYLARFFWLVNCRYGLGGSRDPAEGEPAPQCSQGSIQYVFWCGTPFMLCYAMFAPPFNCTDSVLLQQ